jgi:putative transposase
LIVTRAEKHLIKKSNPMWHVIDEKSLLAKNLHNEVTYIIRQEFFATNKLIRGHELEKRLKDTENFKLLGSQASQKTIQLVDQNFKSYFKAIKDWSRKKGVGYFGKPKLPYYKNKDGRSVVMIKNIQCRIQNGEIYFSWLPLRKFTGIKTSVKGKLQQIRFVPTGASYTMEVVYQTEVPETLPFNNRIMGIDLGVNNLATITNNIGIQPIIVKGGVIKSMNRYYNKERRNISVETNMIWNKRMRLLTDKHMRKMDSYMHLVSRRIVEYLQKNDVDTLVIGLTKEWKDGINIGHVNNQNFVCIPHDKLIKQLQYKCENIGINCIMTEEKFTSGTSFLDNELPVEENYNIKRRIKRGVFKSNDGRKLNSDVNASLQIIKKVFPNAFEERSSKQWDRGCGLQPVSLFI